MTDQDDPASTQPQQPPAQPGGDAPTLWIGLTVLCALAAVGLGIWAFKRSVRRRRCRGQAERSAAGRCARVTAGRGRRRDAEELRGREGRDR